MAALHTRRRKKDIGLARLVPAWREKARALGLVRQQAALVPPRPIHPLTWERVEIPRVPPPDLPANAIRSMKARAGIADAAGRRGRGAVRNRPRPLARAGGAVAGARAGRPGSRGAGRRACGGAADGDPGGGDPRRRAGPRARAVCARRDRRGGRPPGPGRRADRGGAAGDGPRLRHPVGGEGRAPRAGRDAGGPRHDHGAGGRGDGGGTPCRDRSDRRAEGGGPDGAAVGRSGDRRSGPCRQRQDDHAARGEGASRREDDPRSRAVRRRRAGAGARGGDTGEDPAILPHPVRGSHRPRGARPRAGRLRGLGAGRRRGLDDRHRPHGRAARDRRPSRGGPGGAGRRHGAVEGGGRGPALPALAEGGDEDRRHDRDIAPARSGAARRRRPGQGGRAWRRDRGSRRTGAGGAPGRARLRGGAALARPAAGRAGRHAAACPDPCHPPPGQRGGARGAGAGGNPARKGAHRRPGWSTAGSPAPRPPI